MPEEADRAWYLRNDDASAKATATKRAKSISPEKPGRTRDHVRYAGFPCNGAPVGLSWFTAAARGTENIGFCKSFTASATTGTSVAEVPQRVLRPDERVTL